jgi:hypothetical protein
MSACLPSLIWSDASELTGLPHPMRAMSGTQNAHPYTHETMTENR